MCFKPDHKVIKIIIMIAKKIEKIVLIFKCYLLQKSKCLIVYFASVCQNGG